MRSLIAVFVGFTLLTASAAQAEVSILVDKDAQAMTVAVDGVERYQWPVSTGTPSHETPSGSFRAFRMEEDHYSKEFDDAPMPHAIFFTKFGHAIHGTDSIDRLGLPASHGCVRLSRDNASTLFALVQSEGVLNTTVELSGTSQVALAHSRQTKSGAAATRRETTPAAGNRVDQVQGTVAANRGDQRRLHEAQTNSSPYAQRHYYQPRDFFSFRD